MNTDNNSLILHNLQLQAENNKFKRGIHLVNPTQAELASARERAIKEGFDIIYLHTICTTALVVEYV